MKKFLRGLLILFAGLIIIAAGTLYYFTAKTAYYTQIVTTGEPITSEYEETKEVFVQYHYQQAGYNKDGEERQLDFMTHPDLGRPFREEAYLKIEVNRWKGEVGYEEVQETEIPQAALAKLKEEN